MVLLAHPGVLNHEGAVLADLSLESSFDPRDHGKVSVWQGCFAQLWPFGIPEPWPVEKQLGVPLSILHGETVKLHFLLCFWCLTHSVCGSPGLGERSPGSQLCLRRNQSWSLRKTRERSPSPPFSSWTKGNQGKLVFGVNKNVKGLNLKNALKYVVYGIHAVLFFLCRKYLYQSPRSSWTLSLTLNSDLQWLSGGYVDSLCLIRWDTKPSNIFQRWTLARVTALSVPGRNSGVLTDRKLFIFMHKHKPLRNGNRT